MYITFYEKDYTEHIYCGPIGYHQQISSGWLTLAEIESP